MEITRPRYRFYIADVAEGSVVCFRFTVGVEYHRRLAGNDGTLRLQPTGGTPASCVRP
jgi:hypothetical protein